jgi:hypothetical protein
MAASKVAIGGKSSNRKKALDTIKNKSISRGQEVLQKRARRVAVSKPLSGSLSRVTKDRFMKKAYNRTLYKCGQQMVQSEGKIVSWWCGYRWCVSCSVIRVARMYAGYGEEIESWEKKYFVTLTAPNVKGHNLRSEIMRYQKIFRLCWMSLKRKKLDVKMVRSMEITYNEKRDDYHPHIHLIVKGRQVSEALVEAWLKRNPAAKRVAQDIRECNDSSINEVFKYSAKLSIKKEGKVNPVPPEKLDLIFSSIRGLRMWSAVGIRSKNGVEEKSDEDLETKESTLAFKRMDELVNWEWAQSIRDWVDFETGEVLSEYEPSERAEKFIRQLESTDLSTR